MPPCTRGVRLVAPGGGPAVYFYLVVVLVPDAGCVYVCRNAVVVVMPGAGAGCRVPGAVFFWAWPGT
jgi:hypothetical protein